jgi:5-methylcytosine-specific restriction endonuclease McrA
MAKTMRSDARFCSEKCNNAAHALWYKLAKRAKVRGPRKTKIRRIEIADRDNWRCGICTGRIDKMLSHPNPGALSMDHIVPMAEGGTNDPANLRAVHLRCNLSRRDRGGDEQLLLVG